MAMTSAGEYRKLLEECLHWADNAASEEERKSFLQLAKTWYEAALREEQSLGLVAKAKTCWGVSAMFQEEIRP